MAKDLTRRTVFDQILRNKTFNPKHHGYQRVLLQWFINFLIKRLRVVLLKIQNKELAEELHKLIIEKFEKQKVHSSFIDIIWDADLACQANSIKNSFFVVCY